MHQRNPRQKTVLSKTGKVFLVMYFLLTEKFYLLKPYMVCYQCVSVKVIFIPTDFPSNIFSLRFDQEIFSTVFLSLPLIQEGRLSVSGKRICIILVNRLEDCLPSKSDVR